MTTASKPAAVTAAGQAATSGTQTDEFDPTGGSPGWSEAAAGGANRPPASDAGGDRTAAGQQPDEAAGSTPPAPKQPEQSAAGGDELDPAEEALAYYRQLLGDAGPDEESGETEPETTITPETLKAEIESSTEDPQERFEKLLSRVGSMANELGKLRQVRAEFETLMQGLEPFMDRDPTTGEPVAVNPVRLLQALAARVDRDTLNHQLAQVGLKLVPVDWQPSAGQSNGDQLAALAAEVAKQFALDVDGLDTDEVLEVVRANPRAELELTRRLTQAEHARLLSEQQAREKAAAERARMREQVSSYLARLEKSSPHFEELSAAMLELNAEIPMDKPLLGLRRAEVLHALAELRRLPVVLREVAAKARAAERARLTKALLALGWDKARAEGLFAQPAPGGKQASPAGRAAEALASLADDGSYDTWTS